MKVFISWSGTLSHKVALVLRDWLPSVIQSLDPYVSSEDIDKGARWSSDISGELEDSSYGILCLTTENINAPWLNFEAGALSKSVDKSRVSPFLFGLKRSEVQGPLLQFQSVIFDKSDVKKLINSLNGWDRFFFGHIIEEARIDSVFDVWWPRLQEELNGIQATPVVEVKTPEAKTEIESNDILEEILDLVRNHQKILNDPEKILPEDYLAYVFNKTQAKGFIERVDEPKRGRRSGISPAAIRDFENAWDRFVSVLNKYAGRKTVPRDEVLTTARDIYGPLEYILDKSVDIIIKLPLK